ncbi:MAG: hypothetical protein K6F53_07445 [Lachnospiraceae bacterium]|nr:hypothetical protein [Lachnospiraceae bacterium]
MRKKLRSYINETERTVKEGISPENAESFRKEMLVRISFFQHERLIHLIVTALFAILTFLSLLGYFQTCQICFIALTVLLLVLLIPYVYHYYVLENGVQKLYEIYESIGSRNPLDRTEDIG